jgi:3-methyladenine DNA glycosylase/8-oxoguanine DNA glycosylase
VSCQPKSCGTPEEEDYRRRREGKDGGGLEEEEMLSEVEPWRRRAQGYQWRRIETKTTGSE